MTNINEVTSQKARGRPMHPLMASPAAPAVLAMFPEVKTRRGQLDVLYRQHALDVLLGAKEVGLLWLADPDKMTAGALHAWRPYILTALGKAAWRFGSDTMLEWARELDPAETTDRSVMLIRMAAAELERRIKHGNPY